MRRLKLQALVLVVAVLAAMAVNVAVAAQQTPVPLEVDFARLKEIANGYPPRVETSEEHARAEALWRSVETRLLEKRQASSGNFDIELQLGDCYRMGHNLDVEGAWDKAVTHLTEAARLGPASPVPPTLLGLHYTGSGQAAEAEAQLLKALSLSGESPSSLIHYGLAFTYYQLSQFEKVVPHATEYLKVDPGSQGMNLMKDRAEAALRGEFKPETITIEAPPKEPVKDVVREKPPASSPPFQMPEYNQPPFSSYYLNPQPDTLPTLLAELQKQEALSLGRMAAAGFLSQVFRDNPDRLADWTPAIWQLQDSAREYVWLAVWFSGTEPAMKLLREVVQKEKEPVAKSISVLTDSPASPLTAFPVDSGETLDLLWGAFFATGRQEYITKLIECLPRSLKDPQENALDMAIGKAAEWSLRENARHHPRVLAICKSELDRQTGDTRRLLSQVILEAEKKVEP